MFIVCVLLVLASLVYYWIRQRVWANSSRPLLIHVLLLAMLLSLLYAGRSGEGLQGSGAPILLALATDVSLSMGTLPDPATMSDVGTRLQRAQQVLLPVLANLSAASRPALVSVTAFTSKSETILAWDDDLSLAREIIEFVLTTGLLTEAGSDLSAALTGVVPIYESLPETYQNSELAKFLIVISDGEQTTSRASSDVALARLRELGVRVISLYIGLPDTPEGLPVYDENNDFVGFEEISGQILSVSDPELMNLIAGTDRAHGLFVSAEDDAAVATITDFIGLQTAGSTGTLPRILVILILWASLLYILLRWY